MIQTLGLASIPAPGRVNPPAAPVYEELGVSGTPILSGFLRDVGEYNPELTGLSAYRIYEKMRRSDGQVAGTMAAVKLPIRSAEWTVVAPENASPVEQEATDFARECLLEEIDFDLALSNALLMLDFGASAHEDIWYVDGNRVRLRALAARPPITFYKWETKPGTDELVAIVQQGWKSDAYVTTSVPVEKIALFINEREGANFAGRSLMRAMYQHWYIKNALYKIDSLACERNGLGIPAIETGPDQDAKDRKTAIAWLEALCAHERASILLPPQWKFTLTGVTGQVRDCKESILHHNLMISMAALAMFLNLGQTATGARSLGESMSDFFGMAVQATANRVARTFNLSTVKRLVDFNFKVARYPKLVPQQILSVKFEALVTALKDLAASSIVMADDELEGWIRKKLGAPEAGTPRRVPAAGKAAPVETGEAATADGEEPPASPSGKENPTVEEKAGGSSPDRRPDARLSEIDGVKLRRQPKPIERCLALSEIVGALDRGRADIAAALRAAKSRLQAEIVNKLVTAPIASLHRVSVAPDAKLVAAVEAVIAGVHDFGMEQISKERDRQRGGAAPGDAREARVEMAQRVKREPLGIYADAVVSEFENNLTARAANVALDYRRRPGDLTTGEIIRKVEEDLDEQSDKWIDGVAAKGANEAFADGREAGYDEMKDEIGSVIYSALLDINTCEACAAADGQEGATPDDIPGVPNPDCDGGDKCRCVHVFVFKDEGTVE